MVVQVLPLTQTAPRLDRNVGRGGIAALCRLSGGTLSLARRETKTSPYVGMVAAFTGSPP